MGIVKFKTGYSADRIEKVEVLRETSQYVYLHSNITIGSSKSERRDAKNSAYTQYHDTWADAHYFLMDKAQSDVEQARMRLEKAKGLLGNIKGMKPPKEAA